MLDSREFQYKDELRTLINQQYRVSETTLVPELLSAAALSPELKTKIFNTAMDLVKAVRHGRKQALGVDSFLKEYALSTDEGIALMCLAEALLRVPDSPTINLLIKDKIAPADWRSHQGHSDSFFINATTWALMLTGKILSPEKASSSLSQALLSLVNRSSEGMLRLACDKAMRIMSKQFVMGRDIQEALDRANKLQAQGLRYS